ncbi:MAG: RadC family protein [Candidatus Onthomonas sp.]
MEPDKDKPADPKPQSRREPSIHTGHRKRVKARLLEYGGQQFDDYQLVELLLFYTHPRGDVNPLAHRMINRFGSLKAILDASPDELKEVVGVSDNTAALFRLCREVTQRYYDSSREPGTPIRSTEEAAEILAPYFLGAREEMVYLLSVDSKGKLLGCDLISEGSADAVLLNQRKIVERAINRRASQVYLAHCHVSGLAWASRDDIWSTRQLNQALRLLNIRLLDHLIFSDGDYISMAQSELLDETI